MTTSFSEYLKSLLSEYGHWLTSTGVRLIDSDASTCIDLVDDTDSAHMRGYAGWPTLRNPETGEVMDPETGEFYVWLNDDSTLGW